MASASYTVRLNHRELRNLDRHPDVLKVTERVARDVSSRAERNSQSERVRASQRVEFDRSSSPPAWAACEGDSGRAFIAVFEEFGGEGQRPPNAPLRRAAQAVAGSDYRPTR